MAMMLISCVAFIQDNKFFSSAPKEAREVLVQREHELFYGARAIGWTLFIMSVLMILGVGVIAFWDGIKSGFTFWQFFLRFVLIFTIYKICDMALIDNFLLLKFHFFQHYYPEAAHVMEGRKYGFNIKSQLAKLEEPGQVPDRQEDGLQHFCPYKYAHLVRDQGNRGQKAFGQPG